MPLRLAFMGTPDFAVPALKALAARGHEIVCVYSQPPRPAGRGQKEQKSPVHLAAEEMGIPVRTPARLKNAEDQQAFADLKLDAAVVAAYGLILPLAVLEAPRLGCINIHGSLLPRWRGAAPLQRAMLAGDADTGITIMQMAAGLDTGDMWLKKTVPITTKTTASSLHDALSALGAEMIGEALEGIASGTLRRTPQPEEGVTYAAKLERGEGKIDWNEEAAAIERKTRALNPRPGVYFEARGERIKILSAELVMDKKGEPGTLLADDFTVACGEDALRLLTVQRQGKAAMEGAAFLRGFTVKPGDRLA
jgi:methionyl-tRNA formyltransferase